MFNVGDKKVMVKDYFVLALIVLLIFGGAIWRYTDRHNRGFELIEEPPEAVSEIDMSEISLITVHLAGAVKRPGIYQLPLGARVYELLDQGGGFLDGADADRLNQARPLIDGEQVYIPMIGETPQVTSIGGEPSARININTADAGLLSTLPGIGEVKARDIVAHREKVGHFSDISELMDVSGIGEKTYERIAELITIY